MNTPSEKLKEYAKENNFRIWQIIFDDTSDEALYVPALSFDQAQKIAQSYIECWNLNASISSIQKYN